MPTVPSTRSSSLTLPSGMSRTVESTSEAASPAAVDSTLGTRRFLDGLLADAALPFAVGGFSGMVATTCIQPIDMVKVRLQLIGEGTKGGPKPSHISVVREIIAQGGILNLYSGLSAAYLRQMVYGTARLGLFDTFIGIFERRAESKRTKIGFGERTLAGMSAGGLGALMGNPTEVLLIRMQSDGLKPQEQRANYRSIFDALARITRTEGIRALWSGAFPTVIRATATNFGQLTFFSETKYQLKRHTSFSPQAITVTASTIGGFFAALFSLPFDMTKTRLQRQTKAADASVAYKNMFDCFVKVARNEGLLRFYRGFGHYFFRMAPHSVITLVVADNLWSLIR